MEINDSIIDTNTDVPNDTNTHEHSNNININVNNMTFNVSNYCEKSSSKHEIEHDPDLNFFNNINFPTSDYIDLNKVKNYLEKMKYTTPFNLAHLNCRSIYRKIDEIAVLVTELNTNIFAVTETWLEQEIADLISISGFKFEHKARTNTSKGGGVGFFINESLKYKIVNYDIDIITTFEYIIVQIDMEKNKNIKTSQ